ncbi:hypothetical protein BT96DRAFT_974984 [Gymnopus androsaceus JB14]|uniref:Uncharacterized protein n=1 Tax=Gymnopus androsaceus JB14 TaxID=1447944 RepID=A0A6A4HPI7_9AGAR|nr:hypothetical protein BT96DRAFT_974984 [Gymnopus androsaceus JB14]
MMGSLVFNGTVGSSALAMILEVFLFGIYITHFFSYVRILSHKRRNIMIISGILLICAAAVGTVFGILDARNMLAMTLYATENNGQVDNELWDTMVWMRALTSSIYLFANFIGDLVLIHRCFVIWGYNTRIITIPAIASVLNTLLAIAATVITASSRQLESGVDPSTSLGSKSIILFVNLAVNWCTNFTLTLLIAIKVRSIRIETKELLGRDSTDGRYTNLPKIALESGMLYPVIVAICLAIQVSGTYADLYPLLTIIAGLAPTLILVRASLGLSVEHRRQLKPLYLHSVPTKDMEEEKKSSYLSMRPMSGFNGSFVSRMITEIDVPTLKSCDTVNNIPSRPPSIYGGHKKQGGRAARRSVRFAEPGGCIDCSYAEV